MMTLHCGAAKLREQKSDFDATRRAALADFSRAKIGAVDDAMRLLRGLRRELLATLADADLTNWDRWYRTQLLARTDELMTDLEGNLASTIAAGQHRAAELAAASVDAPLAAVGVDLNLPLISANQVAAAARFSADRVAGFTRDVRHRVLAEFAQLNAAISQGVASGESLFAVQQKVRALLETPTVAEIRAQRLGGKLSAARDAETITRTEMHRIYSQAGEARLEAANERVPGMGKEWSHGPITKWSRPAHVALDGVIIRADELFNVNGFSATGPHADSLPAGEVIRCQCTLAPVLPEDVPGVA